MSGKPVRSTRMVVGTAGAAAAAVVALVLGPAGGQSSSAVDLAAVTTALAAGSASGTAAGPAEPAPRYLEAAAADYFLKIDGIEGESADRQHQGEIEINSFSWGVTNPTPAHTGGGMGTGKAQFQDLHVSALFSKASPKLALACARGEQIPNAVLTVRKAGKEQQEYLKIELKNVQISSYQTGGSGDLPTDQFALSYGSATVQHVPSAPPAGTTARS